MCSRHKQRCSEFGIVRGGTFHLSVHETRSTIYVFEASHNGLSSPALIHNGVGRLELIDEAAELDPQQRRLMSTDVFLQHVRV